MSELLDEINKRFSNLPEGRAYKVSRIAGAAAGWLIREKNGLMIAALPTDYSKDFDEKFQGIHMRTSIRSIEGVEVKLISIESDQYETRTAFARLCEDFLDESAAHEISLDPKQWWHDWTLLMGNSSVTKKPYAVLGELHMLKKLIDSGETPSWGGPTGRSHDITLARQSFEVKSTLGKVDQTVTISSQYQMIPPEKGNLFLAHLRFELDQGDISINSAARSLISAGFDEEVLESKLKQLGYPQGRTSRDTCYGILTAEIYAIDNDFPRIIPESFKGGKLPTGVVKIIYDVNLANLQRTQLDHFIKEGWGK